MVLAALADDPLGLLTSCRRLLDRQPAAGALWWVCARLIEAADARAEALAIVRDLAEPAALRALCLDVPERARVAVLDDPAGGSDLIDVLAGDRDDLTLLELADPADVTDVADAAGVADPADVLDLTAGADASAARPEGAGAGVGLQESGPPLVLVEAGAVGPDRFLTVPGTGEAVAAARARGVPVWLVVHTGRRLPRPLFDVVARRASTCEVAPISAVDRLVEPRQVDCPCPPELLRPAGGD